MNNISYNKKNLLFLVILFNFFSCPNKQEKQKDVSTIVTEKYEQQLKQSWDSVNSSKSIIKDGDLICRTGFDYISKSLQSFNDSDKTYSHSGLAFKEDGKIYIYHAIAGDDENPSECFMKELYDSFVNPEKKYCFGIFRYKIDTAETNCLHEKFKDLEKRKVKFDKLFDMQNDDKLYCSEAIAKSLNKCTNNRIQIPTTKRFIKKMKEKGYQHLEGKTFEYWALDNLYRNTYCMPITKIVFPMGYPKPTR